MSKSADIYLTIKPRSQSLAHSWKTTILRGTTGEEWRSGLFTWPRISTRVSFTKSDDTITNWLRRNLFKYNQSIWGIPIWNDLTELRATASSGATQVLCTTTANRHYYNKRQVALIDKTDFTSYEIAIINQVSATTLAVSDLLSNTWDSETTYVAPILNFRLGSNFNIKRTGSKVDTIDLDAKQDMSVVSAFSYTTPATAATYLGHPVYEQVIQSTKEQSFLHPNLVSGSIGKTAVDSWYGASDANLISNFNVLLGTKADIQSSLDFFDNRFGRLMPFWIPTWNRDLYPTAAITAGATLISVEDYEYDELFAGNAVINRHLFIGFPDRTYICRKITAATATTITLNQSLETAIRTIEFPHMLFSFLNFSRFMSDRLELTYSNSGVASFNMGAFGLIKESP